MTVRTIGLSLALGALAAFPAASAAQNSSAEPQSIIDLGTLGHDISFAVAVNDKTQVIGWIADNFEPFRAPFLWEDGVMRELTSGPDLHQLEARDINNRGQIAGFGADVTTGRFVALVWQDGRPTRLPTPPGDIDCVAEALNDHGDVVGSCATRDGSDVRFHAVLWRDGEVIDVAPLAGGGQSTAIAINDHGVVLGALRTPEGSSPGGFLWREGLLVRLDPALFAADINDRGQVVASGPLPAGGGFGPLIIDRGTSVRLPGPSASVNCFAEAIDNRSDAGGLCDGVPTVWVRGEPKILPALSEFFASVTDLNDRGDAVGYSTAPSPDNNARAVLWPGAAKQPPDHVNR